jgi:3-methyladenine DNA glycosylase/8-oxoguanine DNA glycosylase
MKQTLVTVNFSVDRQVQEQLDAQAAEEKRSKSDIFREMYRLYRLDKSLDAVYAQIGPALRGAEIQTDEDVARLIREG